jgi:alpha-mannosidase
MEDNLVAETVQQIRDRLGIPSTAQYVLILDQAAHMDWDWNLSFMQYFWHSGTIGTGDGAGYGVNNLLSSAFDLLESNTTGAKPHYYYSLCEMGFFRKFIEAQTAQGVDIVRKIKEFGHHLRIVGGGMVSPDCLLSSGEGFLRNYLLGKLWLAEHFPNLLPLKHCWLPDDFGQDPELPVAVKALGMTSHLVFALAGNPAE